MLTPKISANRGRVVMSGIATAFSHLETDWAPIPSRSASCSWVMLALKRSCLIFFPSSMVGSSLQCVLFAYGPIIPDQTAKIHRPDFELTRLLGELQKKEAAF